jgi:hypothetical protein
VSALASTALRDTRLILGDVPRGLWLASLICAGWDTALRLGDLLAMRHPLAEEMVIQQHKTGDDVWVRLRPETLRLVDRLRDRTRSAVVWPLWAGRREFYVQFAKLVRRTGLTGTFRFIRRGAITAVELAGEDGSRLAGHRSRAVTVRSYIDPHLLRSSAPPELVVL